MPESTPTSIRARSWPFMVAPTHHDRQVSAHGVRVPARQEVEFKDGERIWLARVMCDGMPHGFLRDLGHAGSGPRVDLRKLIDNVESELPTSSTRDVATYVALSLRSRYPTARDFLNAATRA